jgi:hypothetical protein
MKEKLRFTMTQVLLLLVCIALAGGCNKGEQDKTKPSSEESLQGTNALPDIKSKILELSKNSYKPTYPLLAMPEDVLFVIGLTGLEQIVQALNIMGTGVLQDEMPPNLASLAVERIKELFGFVDVSWLPRNEPIRAMFADPKKHAGKGAVFMLPITDAQKFKESIAPSQLRGLTESGFSFEHDYQRYQVELLPGYVVITDRADFYENVRDFTLDLLDWTPPHLISVKTNIPNLRRIYGFEYAKFTDGVTLDILGDSVAGPPSALRSFVAKEFEELVMLSYTLQQVDIHVAIPRGNSVELNVVLSSNPGSPLETLAKVIVGQTCSLADMLPTEIAVGLSTRLDHRAIEALNSKRKHFVKLLGDMLDMTRQEAVLFGALVERFWMLATGESALAVHIDGHFPYGLTYLMQLEQAKAAKPILNELFELVAPRAWMALDIGQVKNLEELLWSLGELAKEFGGELVTVIAEKDGVEVAGIKLDMDWDSFVITSERSIVVEALLTALGTHFELAFAYKDSMMAFAFGPKGINNAIEALTAGHERGELVLGDVAQRSAVAVLVRFDLLMALAKPILALLDTLVAPLAKGLAATVSLRSDGNQLTLAADMPFDTLRSLFKAALPKFSGDEDVEESATAAGSGAQAAPSPPPPNLPKPDTPASPVQNPAGENEEGASNAPKEGEAPVPPSAPTPQPSSP